MPIGMTHKNLWIKFMNVCKISGNNSLQILENQAMIKLLMKEKNKKMYVDMTAKIEEQIEERKERISRLVTIVQKMHNTIIIRRSLKKYNIGNV